MIAYADIDEDHPVWEAIDTGGGQTCNVAGVLKRLEAAGYAFVRHETTPSTPFLLPN